MEDASSCECSDNESEEFVSERLPSSNNVIRGQKDAYAVGKKIAPGKYGAVYEVKRKENGMEAEKNSSGTAEEGRK